MVNPITQILVVNRPFIYFHTHVVDRRTLDEAIAAKKSLELDISIAPDGSIYIGHPLAMYKFYGKPPPNNVPLDTALKEAKAADLFLMFDCKDVRVLPRVQQAIEEYGVDDCILHACVQELIFKPYSKKIVVEPHWNDEQLPLAAVLAVKEATKVPLALCCRGISQELLEAQGEESVLQKILEVAEGNGEVVVLNLPKDEVTPLSLMNRLLEHNILSLIGIDHTPVTLRPNIYVGATDNLQQATA